uniref:Putative vacuolar h+-atpase v1 sector subunit e n=1 Tax=Rhodnius prolixus TaxID=13249 RepID=A0A4P6D6P4_RHOPR
MGTKITWEEMQDALLYLMNFVVDDEEEEDDIIGYFNYRSVRAYKPRAAERKIDMLSNKIKMMGDARLVYQDMDYKNKLNEIRREKYAAKDQVDLQFERKLIAVYKRYTMDLIEMRRKAKLALLNFRYRLVLEVLDEAKVKLHNARKGEKSKALMRKLMISGILALRDPNPVMRVRSKNLETLSGLIPVLKKELLNLHQIECNLRIDRETFLNANSSSLRIYTSDFKCFAEISLANHFDQCVKFYFREITRQLVPPDIKLDLDVHCLKVTIMKVRKARPGDKTRYIIRAGKLYC